eukprot:5132546-Pleurochrysis_carterae.AAC.2
MPAENADARSCGSFSDLASCSAPYEYQQIDEIRARTFAASQTRNMIAQLHGWSKYYYDDDDDARYDHAPVLSKSSVIAEMKRHRELRSRVCTRTRLNSGWVPPIYAHQRSLRIRNIRVLYTVRVKKIIYLQPRFGPSIKVSCGTAGENHFCASDMIVIFVAHICA